MPWTVYLHPPVYSPYHCAPLHTPICAKCPSVPFSENLHLVVRVPGYLIKVYDTRHTRYLPVRERRHVRGPVQAWKQNHRTHEFVHNRHLRRGAHGASISIASTAIHTFRHDSMDGHGIYKFQGGRVYTGDWKNGPQGPHITPRTPA